jgi:hypothetical protein
MPRQLTAGDAAVLDLCETKDALEFLEESGLSNGQRCVVKAISTGGGYEVTACDESGEEHTITLAADELLEARPDLDFADSARSSVEQRERVSF